MADFIQANNITGLKVYGQQQVDYTVNGEAGCDFGAAVARASMQRAVSVESATSALADVVRARERKLTEIGEALAYVAAAAANFTSKSKTDDSTSSPGLATAKDILDRYGIDTSNIVVVDLSGRRAYRRHPEPVRGQAADGHAVCAGQGGQLPPAGHGVPPELFLETRPGAVDGGVAR